MPFTQMLAIQSRSNKLQYILHRKKPSHSTKVWFASFFSSGFTTMAVINLPERKLAKRMSLHSFKFRNTDQSNFDKRWWSLYSTSFYILLAVLILPWAMQRGFQIWIFLSDWKVQNFVERTHIPFWTKISNAWGLGLQDLSPSCYL